LPTRLRARVVPGRGPATAGPLGIRVPEGWDGRVSYPGYRAEALALTLALVALVSLAPAPMAPLLSVAAAPAIAVACSSVVRGIASWLSPGAGLAAEAARAALEACSSGGGGRRALAGGAVVEVSCPRRGGAPAWVPGAAAAALASAVASLLGFPQLSAAFTGLYILALRLRSRCSGRRGL